MSLEKAIECLNIESYRQLRLYEEDFGANLVRLLKDIEAKWDVLKEKRERKRPARVLDKPFE